MSKKYVCIWCEESSTAKEWTATSRRRADEEREVTGGTYPDDWTFEDADPGDTVFCPKCEADSERDECVEEE